MPDDHTPKVLNCHHFGGSDKLPANAVYIGRPSRHGNPYSSKSGLYTKEDCVALHRIEVYRTLKNDDRYFQTLVHDLKGKDLGCWCKQPKRVVGCHGDNYLHVLSDRLKDRVYDKSIISYLMDDLRHLLKALEDRIHYNVANEDYMLLFIHLGDVRLSIVDVLGYCRDKFVNSEDLNFFVASLIVDLDLALQDDNVKMVEYRFDHIIWAIDRFITNRKDRDREPIPPTVPLKRKLKGVSVDG